MGGDSLVRKDALPRASPSEQKGVTFMFPFRARRLSTDAKGTSNSWKEKGDFASQTRKRVKKAINSYREELTLSGLS